MPSFNDPQADDPAQAVRRLGRNAGLVLMALQSDSGFPTYALHDALATLRDAADAVLTSPRDAVVRYDPSRQDLEVLALIAEPPAFVPTASQLTDESLAFCDYDRHTAMDVLAKLQLDELTPPDVDLAAQRVNHHLRGDSYPFRPLPRLQESPRPTEGPA